MKGYWYELDPQKPSSKDNSSFRAKVLYCIRKAPSLIPFIGFFLFRSSVASNVLIIFT